MRKILALAVLSFFLPAAVAFAANFSSEQLADLKRISAALNVIDTMQGHFLQIGPDGSAQKGTFYLRKPGRLRFEYDPPVPTLVVSDGTTIAVQNSELHTTDRYPLVDSPLRLLLSANVDLAADPRISDVKREPGLIAITAKERSGPAQGQITITLADPSLEIRQWEVVDAQGLHTLVSVSDTQSGVDVPPQKFVIEDQNPFGRRNE